MSMVGNIFGNLTSQHVVTLTGSGVLFSNLLFSPFPDVKGTSLSTVCIAKTLELL